MGSPSTSTEQLRNGVCAALGLILCLFGIHNLVNAALNPGVFCGVCFLGVGCTVALTYSDDVRIFVIQNLLSKNLISLLYDK